MDMAREALHAALESKLTAYGDLFNTFHLAGGSDLDCSAALDILLAEESKHLADLVKMRIPVSKENKFYT